MKTKILLGLTGSVATVLHEKLISELCKVGQVKGGDPSQGGGDPQEQQILQMLASLPPQEQQQIIQQLLAASSY